MGPKDRRAADGGKQSEQPSRPPRTGWAFEGPPPPPNRAPRPDASLAPASTPDEVLPAYRDTPIEQLLALHNRGVDFPVGQRPVLITATCVDPRIVLRLPARVSFIIRSAGVHMSEHSLFQFAFMHSVVGIRHLALMGHEDCAMVDLERWRERFVQGMSAANGVGREDAEAFFDRHRRSWSLDDEVASLRRQASFLRERFPSLLVAPLLYRLDGVIEQVVDVGECE